MKMTQHPLIPHEKLLLPLHPLPSTTLHSCKFNDDLLEYRSRHYSTIARRRGSISFAQGQGETRHSRRAFITFFYYFDRFENEFEILLFSSLSSLEISRFRRRIIYSLDRLNKKIKRMKDIACRDYSQE